MDVKAFLLEKKKEIAILVVVIIVLVVLWQLGSGMVTPKELELSFSESSVTPGKSTVLTVWVTNVQDQDLTGAKVSVSPESDAITVEPPEYTESIIGPGSRRKFDFNVSVSENATLGSYALEVGFRSTKALTHLSVVKS